MTVSLTTLAWAVCAFLAILIGIFLYDVTLGPAVIGVVAVMILARLWFLFKDSFPSWRV